MAGYTRQSEAGIVDGAAVSASDLNAEFNQLESAMDQGSGHSHDGTAGNAPKITNSGLANNAVATATIQDDAVTGAKIDSATTITAASFVGNLDADSATIDSLTITSGTAVTSIDTDLSSVSNSDDTLASAKAIKAYVDAQVDTADQLTELTDVTITSVADNEVLAYNNATSKWINQTAVEAGLQPNDAGLTSIAGLTTAADKMIYTTGSDVYATTGLTAAGRAILDDANASAQRTTLGLAIGTNVQAYDAGLNSIAGLTTDADKMIYTTALDTYATTSLTTFGRSLIDDDTAATARTTLGLGTAATTASTAYATAAQGTTADNALPKSGGTMTGDITFNSTQTFDGRDVSADGAKLDLIEDGADVTDSTNVEAAGALMDSEVTNLAQVKAFSSADYATAAQGTTADSALQPSDNISELTNDSGFITGNQTITLSGDATGSGTTAITVALAANTVGVNELNLTDGTAGQFLKTDGAGNISFADAPAQGTSFTTLDVDNLNLDGNTISSTDTNGNIRITPDGTGSVEFYKSGAQVSDIDIFRDQTFASGFTYVISEQNYYGKDNTGVKTNFAEIKVSGDGATNSSGTMTIGVSSLGTGPGPTVGGTGFNIVGAGDSISTYGELRLINSNLRVSSGYGIDFSLDANASGMTSELLDDYEEGTFTPYYSNTSGTAVLSGAYEAQDGKYVKMGRLVHCSVNLALNFAQTKSISSGELCLSGMPFAPDVLVAFSVWPDEASYFNWGSGFGPKTGRFRTSGNRATLFYIDASRNYQKADISQITTGTTGNNPIRATFTYYTTS